MTFREMAKYEEGLSDLERRMKAICWFTRSIRSGDFQDFEEIIGLSSNPQLDGMCFESLEARFTDTLLRLVGPNGMHPKLKSPECYAAAHAHLWKDFPRCNHDGSCESAGETVTVDFTESAV